MRQLFSLGFLILLGLAANTCLAQAPAARAARPMAPEEAQLQAQATQYLLDGNSVEFIRVKQRLLVLEEARYGLDSPEVVATLDLLASQYEFIGRQDLAAPLRARAEAIKQRPAFVPLFTEDEISTLINSVYGKLLAGDHRTAEAMMRRALAMLEGAPGARTQQQVGLWRRDALVYLADALKGQRRHDDAEHEYRRALAEVTLLPSPDPESRIFIEQRLFQLYAAQQRWQDAEAAISTVSSLIAAQGRPVNEDESQQFASYYRERGQYPAALQWKLREMQAIYRRLWLTEPDAWGVQVAKQRGERWRFISFLSTTSLGFDHVKTSPELLAASFEAAQLALASDVGLSVARMAMRQGAAGDEFARLLRQQHDARQALAGDEQMLGSLLADSRRDPTELAAMRARIAATETAIASNAREMQTRFPRAQAMVNQAPLHGQEALALLRPREALLMYVVDRHTTYAWVMRKETGLGYSILPLDQEALERDIAAFRATLTSGETGWSLRAMSPADGVGLYTKLVAPLQSWLQDVDRILLVADGPLQGLPFAALADGEASPDWLGKRYAFSVLPSVAALRALRGVATPRPPGLSFAGFGDPRLAPTGNPIAGLAMRSLYGKGSASEREGRLVDPALLRDIESLPDTGIELKAVARLLNAPADSLHLGDQATETEVKRLALDNYRILSFATHGVMAGELTEGIEPGLILTPPEAPTQLDDGYLSASEAAQLKLDADWVLLSACNTAAPDGTPGAEGLSGLANAFLYAGARALLVSHWRVSSEATTKLVAETIAAYAKAPQEGKAVALQAAMQATMAKPEYAHPYFWAAFSVIGD